MSLVDPDALIVVAGGEPIDLCCTKCGNNFVAGARITSIPQPSGFPNRMDLMLYHPRCLWAMSPGPQWN